MNVVSVSSEQLTNLSISSATYVASLNSSRLTLLDTPLANSFIISMNVDSPFGLYLAEKKPRAGSNRSSCGATEGSDI